MIRVLFIDDEPKLRQAWVRLLESQQDLELVGMLERTDDLSTTIAQCGPDVVVVDLSIPGMDPFDEISKAAEANSRARVIVYSGRNDLPNQLAAMDAGAWAFVDKLQGPDEVMDVIRRVAAGEVVLPRGMERRADGQA